MDHRKQSRRTVLWLTLATFGPMALICAALLFLAGQAHAAGSCMGGFPGSEYQRGAPGAYSGHKAAHVAGIGALTLAVSAGTGSQTWGALAGLAGIAAREWQKARDPSMRCEWGSVAFGLAGIGLGLWGSGFVVTAAPGGAAVSYTRALP